MQRYYGIDLDHAIAGNHSAAHIAALVKCLPSDAAMFRAQNPDNAWTLETVLLATLRNDFQMYIWGVGDPKRRGAKPKRIGPSWLTKGDMRKLEARTLEIDELMKELSKPRRSRADG